MYRKNLSPKHRKIRVWTNCALGCFCFLGTLSILTLVVETLKHVTTTQPISPDFRYTHLKAEDIVRKLAKPCGDFRWKIVNIPYFALSAGILE